MGKAGEDRRDGTRERDEERMTLPLGAVRWDTAWQHSLLYFWGCPAPRTAHTTLPPVHARVWRTFCSRGGGGIAAESSEPEPGPGRCGYVAVGGGVQRGGAGRAGPGRGEDRAG